MQMMKPIVSTRGKSAQLRYELPHRTHDATIYPVKASNGSTIILYGHETGVGIIWRGGKPLKKASPPPKQPAKPAKVNGTNHDVIMIIESDDDESAHPIAPPPLPKAEFDDEDAEFDPEEPYQSIVQQINITLHTSVLHIAVPQVPAVSALRSSETVPPIFTDRLIHAVTCADNTVRIITLPLDPPPTALIYKPLSAKSQFGEEIVTINAHQSIPRGVSVTWTARSEQGDTGNAEGEMEMDDIDTTMTPGRRRRKQQNRSRSRPRESEGFDLLVASHSTELGGLLKIWRFGLAKSALNVPQPITPFRTLTLRKPASRIAFNTAQWPNHRHSQLLITDLKGTARIYEVLPPSNRKSRADFGQGEKEFFNSTFLSPFKSVNSNSYAPAILAERKAIVDAAWASGGRHILALLADGEWGVWDVDRSGPTMPSDPSAFSLSGFVGATDKDTSSGNASSPKRSARSSLAPMTPNTRRRKEENLFQGSSANNTIPTRGGVSVALSTTGNGASPEESILIWYGSEVHRIADLAKFWARTASASNGNSLLGPGLALLQDIPLFGDSIISIAQFDSTVQASRLAIPRDTLILAERRLILTTTIIPPNDEPTKGLLFTKETHRNEVTKNSDQDLLVRGELDLNGMDRMLEDMEASLNAPKGINTGHARKVLFASSAA